jgi:hypothetical protein
MVSFTSRRIRVSMNAGMPGWRARFRRSAVRIVSTWARAAAPSGSGRFSIVSHSQVYWRRIERLRETDAT